MNIEKFYQDIQGNYLDILDRLYSEQFIEHFILEFKEDDTMSKLIKAYEGKDIENAFLAVHTLKGLCGTLGFTKLESAAISLTEDLRKKTFDNSLEDYEKVKEEYDSLIQAIKSNL